MAYGNASKKTVPLSALSTEDLDYIAKHINTAYKEQIRQLEEAVENLEENEIGKEYVDNAIQSAISDSWGDAV